MNIKMVTTKYFDFLTNITFSVSLNLLPFKKQPIKTFFLNDVLAWWDEQVTISCMIRVADPGLSPTRNPLNFKPLLTDVK